jgi:aminoglycoside phosphotransferase (APT) family kinase protein
MIDYKKEELELLSHQGHCNKNYLLKQKKKAYLVREFQLADRDRVLEFRVQKRAWLVGIAPKPLFLRKRIMMMAFIQGKHKERLTKRELLSLAKGLKTLHNIPLYKKPILLPLHIRAKARNFKKELVLSHGDLSVGNILFAGRVYLIDWEYAGVQDRYFDLASICESFQLSRRQERDFLHAYSSKKCNPKKLQVYKIIFRTLSKEWFKKLQKGQLPFV